MKRLALLPLLTASLPALTIVGIGTGTNQNAQDLNVFDDGSFNFTATLETATNLVEGTSFTGIQALAAGLGTRQFNDTSRPDAVFDLNFSESVRLGYAEFQAPITAGGTVFNTASGFGLRTTRAFAAGESLTVSITFPNTIGWGGSKFEEGQIVYTQGQTATTGLGQGQIVNNGTAAESDFSAAFGGRIVQGGANDSIGIRMVGADGATIDLSGAATNPTEFFAEGFVPIFTGPGAIPGEHDVDFNSGVTSGGTTTFTNDSTDTADSNAGPGNFEAALGYRDQLTGDNILVSQVDITFTAVDGWAADQQIRFTLDGAPFAEPVIIPEPSAILLALLAPLALLRRKRI